MVLMLSVVDNGSPLAYLENVGSSRLCAFPVKLKNENAKTQGRKDEEEKVSN